MGHKVIRALLAGAALAAASCQPVHAGGLAAPVVSSDPCPPGFVVENDGTMTAEVLRSFAAIRAMSCGPRPFFDRVTGERLTDAELLARVFNGSKPVDVTPVPLPGSALLLVIALAGLASTSISRETFTLVLVTESWGSKLVSIFTGYPTRSECDRAGIEEIEAQALAAGDLKVATFKCVPSKAEVPA